MKRQILLAIFVIGLCMGMQTMPGMAEEMQTPFRQELAQGAQPGAFWARQPERASATVKHAGTEHAMAISIAQETEWSYTLPDIPVKAGETYSIAAVVAGDGSKLGYPCDGAVSGLVSVGAVGKRADGSVLSWQLEPTGKAHYGGQWEQLTATFAIPHDVAFMAVRVQGMKPGTVLLAELGVIATPEAKLTLPSAQNATAMLGGVPVKTRPIDVTATSKFFFFPYPSPMLLSFFRSGLDPATPYTYAIRDAYGRLVAQGHGTMRDGFAYTPEQPGYYEIWFDAQSANAAGTETVLSRKRVSCSAVREVAPRAAGSHPFGMSCHHSLELTALYGASWTRTGIFTNNWAYFDYPVNEAEVRTRREEFERWNLAGFPLMKNLRPQGNNIRPADETAGWDTTGLPKDYAQFANDYAQYAGLENNFVSDFEFENECNGKINSRSWYTMENLVKSLVAANEGVKRANSEARMAVSVYGIDIDFMKKFNAAGGKDAYDILSIHPYNSAFSGVLESPEQGRTLERCRDARQWLDSEGKTDCEIWSTEYGWSTGPNPGSATELQQAQFIVRSSLLQLAGGVSRVLPFMDIDLPGWGPVDGYMGMTRVNGMPKPAFVGYSVMARTVGGRPYRGRLEIGQDIAALVFADDASTVVTMWTPDTAKSCAIKLPCAGTRVGFFGETIPMKQGVYQAQADGSVQYLALPQGFDAVRKFYGPQFIAGWAYRIFASASYQGKTLDVPLRTEADAPVIDGIVDEQAPGAPIEIINTAEQARAIARVLVTDQALYVTARVTGKVYGKNPNPDKEIWNGDTLEIYWSSSEHDRNFSFLRDNIDFHLFVAPGMDGRTARFVDWKVDTALPRDDSAVTRQYRVLPDGGYEIEARIPLSYVHVQDVAVGAVFGFDLQLDLGKMEGGIGRRVQQAWSGGGDNHQSPGLWGRIRLVQ